MIYRPLGRTGINVSAVVYGGIVSAGCFDRAVMPGDPQHNSDRYVGWALEHGVNYFDVAPSYGDAQERLGNSLRPHRGGVCLACKTEKRMRAEAEAEMLRSLELLHTDAFDVYQLHAMSTQQDLDRAFGPGGVMELMREMKEKGLTRFVGITAHSERVALRALEMYDFDTVLFPFNWHMHMAAGMGEKLRHAAKEKGVGLLCMKSMIERAWADEERYASRFPKSWCRPFDPEAEPELLSAAVRYALDLGVDTIVPPGNFDHFRFAVENIDRLLAEPLSGDERALLAARLETVRDRPFFTPDPL